MYFNGTKCCVFILCCLLSLSSRAQDRQHGSNSTPANIPLPLITFTPNPGCIGQDIHLYANADTLAPGITYHWVFPGGATSTLQNPVIVGAALSDKGYYYLTDTINGVASNIDSVYVDVLPTNAASVSITVSPNDTVCRGSMLTFTATTGTGGAAPTYQWVDNSTPVVGAVHSTWSSPTLTDGDEIYCILNSTLVCPTPNPTTSNIIKLNLLHNSPQIYMAASPGTSVTSGAAVSFTSVVYDAGPGATYQWAVNGVLAPGADSSTFTVPSVTGYDTVTLTVRSILSCADPDFASKTIIIHPHMVGVANIPAAFENMALFPNPASGIITLKGSLTNTGAVSVEVLNTVGQSVYNETISRPGTDLNKIINLSNMPDGIYLMRLSQDENNKIFRFTVQH